MMQQQRQQQQSKSFMQQQQMSQQFLQQQQQQMLSMQNGLVESFRVDTFEYRLLHEVEFRRSLTMYMVGEQEVDLGAIQGPPQAPQLQQKPRSTKVTDGGNATFTVRVSGHPSPRVSSVYLLVILLGEFFRAGMSYMKVLEQPTLKMSFNFSVFYVKFGL